MKQQIRHKVFETNSSSTHSLTIEKFTIEDAKQYVDERIKKAYTGFEQNTSYFDENDYIEGNKLILKGIDFESGDENHNVYYIINNWMGKIQYLAMIIDTYAYYIEGYDKDNHSYSYNYYQNNKKLLADTDPYKTFENLVKKYAGLKGYDIDEIVYDVYYSGGVEKIRCSIPDNNFNDIINLNNITSEMIETLVTTVMNEDYIITFCDEAYHPYNKPETYII